MANLDIVLIDEVFAAGVTTFQKKCSDKIKEFQNQGKTIVFVSHSRESVQQICQMTLLLRKGKMLTLGPTKTVGKKYLEIVLNRGGDLNQLNRCINHKINTVSPVKYTSHDLTVGNSRKEL
jgi:ABC-type polysaccharide/polyol phosphate transport system ATPase subunit